MTPVALTIAGSDPSGGAGLQADLKAFHAHGAYGEAVVTLLTVQNTRSVAAVEVLDPGFVLRQLDAVVADIPPHAAKTGALGSAAVIDAVASRARSFAFPLVVDPVMVSKHGAPLMADDAVDTFVRALLPCAHLVTPNLAEASRLAGIVVRDADGMERAARAIASLGARNVLVKGGHLDGDAMDLLWSDGRATCLRAARIASTHTHGTGCVLSASIAARLAHGERLVDAVTEAKRFVRTAIERAPGLGGGCGPIDLFAAVSPPRDRPANTPRS